MKSPVDGVFTLQPAAAQDFEALHALRLRAMRPSLERIGRYDERRARERLAEGWQPPQTQHIVVAGEQVGFLVLKRLSQAWRLSHFSIDPAHARRGIGSAVMRALCAQADAEQMPIELVALKHSDANCFYQRHGFVQVGQGPWDIDYLRCPVTASMRVVRAMWAAVQARDWPAMRALLRDDLQAVWWSSGERFEGADAFVEVQARYPEGWTVHLIELARLDDGRVLSRVRVDHPPAHYFATSIFRIDDGLVASIEETWATLETPPAWRAHGTIAGLSSFDSTDDPRARLA